MSSPLEEIFVQLGFKVDKKQIDKLDKTLRETIKSAMKAGEALGETADGAETAGEATESTTDKIKGFVTGVAKIVGAVAVAVTALDRMATSLAKNNQNLTNFTRQTGLTISNLNKIAGAGMMLDVNFSTESAAQGLTALQSNLAQIRLGQGNIEPFQILGISPVGKDAPQVIEDLRQAIKGVDDMTAVNLIQQMGLSPEFISLLRLTKEEYQDLTATANQFMLNEEQRAALQKYGIELRKIHMQMAYLKDKALIAIMPALNQFLKGFMAILEVTGKIVNSIKTMIEYVGQFKGGLLALGAVVLGITAAFNPLIATLTALYLILEDLAVWALGGDSLFKLGFDKINELMYGDNETADRTDQIYKELTGKDRTAFHKYIDWITSGGVIGSIFGGAKRQEEVYKYLLDIQKGMNSNGQEEVIKSSTSSIYNNNNSNQTKNITQNNYMSFAGGDNGISNAISDLTYAFLQADRVV